MKGFGTVVTGTLLSGMVREGETLTLEPGARTVRVRGLQTHGQPAAVAHAGSRVAVNLSGIDAAEAHRGQTLVVPHTLSGVDTFDAEVTLLPDAPSMKHRARVHCHAFTAETMAGVSLYGYESAQPGSRRLVRLKLSTPMLLTPGDRFVLRQPAPVATIGGGAVLDAHPELKLPKAETMAWLEQLKTADLTQQLILRVQRRSTAGLSFGALSRETGITVDAVRRHLFSAVQQSEILLLPGDLLLSSDAFGSAANRILNLVQQPSTQAERYGLKRSELRSRTGLDAPVFDFVISALTHEKKVQVKDESVMAAGDRGPSSTAHDGRLAAVSRVYEEAGLSSPSVPELAQRFGIANDEMRRIITVLQSQKTIVRMGSDDLFVHADALRKLSVQMTELRGRLIDVAGFKQLTGLSRKYAIPLLEYLDRQRITRKQGNQRLVL
jgi:selenocysteine-specific elongation factor